MSLVKRDGAELHIDLEIRLSGGALAKLCEMSNAVDRRNGNRVFQVVGGPTNDAMIRVWGLLCVNICIYIYCEWVMMPIGGFGVGTNESNFVSDHRSALNVT